MNNPVLALPPQLAAEAEAHEEPRQLHTAQEWNQEQEVHARAIHLRPENHREQLQRLLPGMNLQRSVL